MEIQQQLGKHFHLFASLQQSCSWPPLSASRRQTELSEEGRDSPKIHSQCRILQFETLANKIKNLSSLSTPSCTVEQASKRKKGSAKRPEKRVAIVASRLLIESYTCTVYHSRFQQFHPNNKTKSRVAAMTVWSGRRSQIFGATSKTYQLQTS